MGTINIMNEIYGIINQLIIPAVFITGGFIAGIIFEKIILSKMKTFAERTKWQGDDIIIATLRGRSSIFFILAGLYGAVHTSKLNQDFVAASQKVLIVIVIFLFTILIAKITGEILKLYSTTGNGAFPATSIISNLIKIIIFILGILIILQFLGISITPILTALGVTGLAVALALQDTLSNLFAGIYIILSRQIKIGNYVKLDSGEEGTVVDIAWRNSTIQTIQGNIFIIPNKKLSSSIITNYSLPQPEMSLYVSVGVSYSSDLEKVEQVTIEIAKEVMEELPGGVTHEDPVIRFHTFNDFSIDYTVVLKIKDFIDKYYVQHEFIKRLHKRFQTEGIEIPFPVRTVHIKNQ